MEVMAGVEHISVVEHGRHTKDVYPNTTNQRREHKACEHKAYK